jgi:hypothetical protein
MTWKDCFAFGNPWIGVFGVVPHCGQYEGLFASFGNKLHMVWGFTSELEDHANRIGMHSLICRKSLYNDPIG